MLGEASRAIEYLSPAEAADRFAGDPILALAPLDLAIWAQHLASHKVPLFWRLHKVHHADRDIDVTTAVRFHPVEIALSMLWKIVVVVPLGASWAI